MNKNITRGENVKIIKQLMIMLTCLFLISSVAKKAFADPGSAIILELLVKKGLITIDELNELQDEIAVAEMHAPPSAIAARELPQKPSWADKIRVTGDLRLRDEYLRPGSGPWRNRWRIRARVGLEADITDRVKAGIGLASGPNGVGSARATNQTLTNAFSTKTFNLDKAYIEWKPVDQMKVTGGKYENPLYRPSDLLWDSDLRFEGLSVNLDYPLKENFNIPASALLNAGIFPLAEFANGNKDVWLFAVQGGLSSSIGEDIDWRAMVSYFDFQNIENTLNTALLPTTGSMDPNGRYSNGYDIIEVSGEVTTHYFEKNFDEPFNKPLTLFIDYANNLAVSNGMNNAFQVGLKYGEKPKKLGGWRVQYNFRSLERDSFPDNFPDSDFARGLTDAYGHEAILSYGLAKNMWVDLDYYLFRDKSLVTGANKNNTWGQTVQADFNVKF